MGRKKSGGSLGGIGVLIVLGLIIQYWKEIIIWAPICFIVYSIFKSAATKSKIPSQSSASSSTPLNKPTIGITFNNISRKSNVRENIKFYESEELVQIGARNISAYLTYVGQSGKDLPHLIDPNLSLGDADTTFHAHMGYWPSYESIESNDRATYLLWLSEGRKTPHADIGLVFLYFYGLEQRAMGEGKNHREIFNELIRLLNIYGDANNSFYKYCSGFINWLVLKNPEWPQADLNPLLTYIAKSPLKAFSFRNIISRVLNENNAIEYVSLMFFSHTQPYINSNLREHAILIFEQFKKKLELQPAAWDNIIKKKNKALSNISHTIYYMSASSLRFNDGVQFKLHVLLDRHLSPLSEIWKSSVAEFSEYERIKRNKSELANLFIPEGVEDTSSKKILNRMSEFLAFDDFKICTAKEVIDLLEMKTQTSLTPAQSKLLAQGLDRFKVSIEPDARLTNRGLKTNDHLIIVKRDLSDINLERWSKAVALFDISMAVAISERNASEKEVSHILDFIIQQFQLNQAEGLRLAYRGKLLENINISIPSLAKKISAGLKVEQKELLAKFLFSIACLDGKLEASEIKALEKTYKAFSFSPDILDRFITEFGTKDEANLVVLRETSKKKKGSVIPLADKVNRIEPIVLDPHALRSAFQEAAEVSEILAAVFIEESNDSDAIVETKESLILSDKEKVILNLLSARERWNIDEVENLCRTHGNMYGSFLARVNSFFESTSGSPVLEEEGSELCVTIALIKQEVLSA